MSRVPLLRAIYESVVVAGHHPTWVLADAKDDPPTVEFYNLCRRIHALECRASFSKIEKKGKNWFTIFEFTPERKYRWQMPDEDAARAVERAGMGGGGFAMARRKAIRSYKWDPEAEKWALLRIKNSKKWRAESKARTKAKRAKKRRQKRRQILLERKQQEQELMQRRVT